MVRSKSLAAFCIAVATVLFAGHSIAGSLEGRVVGWNERATYEAWLLTDLDLTQPNQPAARGAVEPRTGRFTLRWEDQPSGNEDRIEPGWLLLRQEIRTSGGAPLMFLLLEDSLPFDLAQPPAGVELHSVDPETAIARAEGRGLEGPKTILPPLLLVLLIFGGGFFARALLRRRLRDLSGERDPAPQPGVALLPPRPEVARWELVALVSILLIAVLIRLPGMVEPLELLEHTYGPAYPGVVTLEMDQIDEVQSAGLLGSSFLLAPFLGPLIVSHPPLYHWLLWVFGIPSKAEWLIRLPALLCALGVVLLTWSLLRRFDRVVGVVAAAATAVAAPLVYFGHDATPYSLSAFVGIASIVQLFRALEAGTVGAWRGWFLLHIVAVLSTTTAVVVPAAHLGVFALFVVHKRAEPRWIGAGLRCVRAGLSLAVIPLMWSFLHFASFELSALDARVTTSLSFVKAEGITGLAWAIGFFTYLCGLPPMWGGGTALIGVVFVGLGLWRLWRLDSLLAALFAASGVALAAALTVAFIKVAGHMGGRIFWGYRWVTWFCPLALVLASLGAREMAERGSRALALGAALLWCALSLWFTLGPDYPSTRPDYRSAGQQIAAELQDGDGLAGLPLWAQHGPLSYYVVRAMGWDGRAPDEGPPVPPIESWERPGRVRRTGGAAAGAHLRRVRMGATDDTLPFQTTARSAQVDRLWVAVVDERRFGRPKWSSVAAEEAVDWAKKTMRLDGRWQYDWLTLYLFSKRPGDLEWTGTEPMVLTAPEESLASLPWSGSMLRSCDPSWDQEGETHDNWLPTWQLSLRVPLSPGAPTPIVRVEHGSATQHVGEGAITLWVAGGPCSGPAPVVTLVPRGVGSQRSIPPEP